MAKAKIATSFGKVLEGIGLKGGIARFAGPIGAVYAGTQVIDILGNMLTESMTHTTERGQKLAESQVASEREARKKLLAFFEKGEARAEERTESDRRSALIDKVMAGSLSALEVSSPQVQPGLTTDLMSMQDSGPEVDELLGVMMEVSRRQQEGRAVTPLQVMGINM